MLFRSRTVKSFAFQEAESISRRAKVCWAARNGHAVLSLQHDGIVVAVKRGSDAGDVAEQMAGASEEALGYRQPCELKDQEPPSGVARPQLATRDEVGRVVPGLGEMEGLPPRHGAWVRDAELQEDPLTRFLLRWDEFEAGTRALSDRNGTQVMMGKDKEPLGSGKGRELNAEVARICLALHRARPFTHLAATDGGRDMPNKWVGDRFVPRPVVSYGVYEGPARFGRPVEGSGQLEGGDDELRLAFGQGLWGGRLPDRKSVV